MAKVKRRCARKPARKQTPEGYVSRQITDYLTAHGLRWKRNQVGVAKYGSHFVKYGEVGEADITVFVPIPGVDHGFYILNVEIKAPKGTQRDGQKLWQQLVEKMGEFYIVARGFEDVESWLSEHVQPKAQAKGAGR